MLAFGSFISRTSNICALSVVWIILTINSCVLHWVQACCLPVVLFLRSCPFNSTQDNFIQPFLGSLNPGFSPSLSTSKLKQEQKQNQAKTKTENQKSQTNQPNKQKTKRKNKESFYHFSSFTYICVLWPHPLFQMEQLSRDWPFTAAQLGTPL